MKDVLTFIFGEISGAMEGLEYYSEEDENSYIVPGDMRLADFYNLTNFDIDDSVMATIGGVAFRLFDCLPAINDSIEHEGYEFIAKEVKGLRISKLLVRKISHANTTQSTNENEHEGSTDEELLAIEEKTQLTEVNPQDPHESSGQSEPDSSAKTQTTASREDM
mgnify:FL=1